MNSCLITLLEQKQFDFSYLGGSTAQSMVLVPDLDSCRYGWVSLFVRLHARDMAAGQSLSFNLYNALPSNTDRREFLEYGATSAGPSSLLTLTLTNSSPTAFPSVRSGVITSPGPYLKVVLTATQASSPAGFYAELSALILMRETT